MKTEKRAGIWMDHSHAHLIEFSPEPMETKVIQSEFSHEDKLKSLSKSERGMHNKEQQQNHEYYHKLAQIILNFQEVVLFGPTDAKSELYNTIKENPLYAHIRIFLLPADKMTIHEEQNFVKDYYMQKGKV
ncbi:MAG: hypothetical protein ABI851_05345 [Saprospiraceae bacterium]